MRLLITKMSNIIKQLIKIADEHKIHLKIEVYSPRIIIDWSNEGKLEIYTRRKNWHIPNNKELDRRINNSWVFLELSSSFYHSSFFKEFDTTDEFYNYLRDSSNLVKEIVTFEL